MKWLRRSHKKRQRPVDEIFSDMDHWYLAASLDLTLELLNAAEKRRSFPGPGREPSDDDDINERYKLKEIESQRECYTKLRASVDCDEMHGVPVARETLENALGLFPTWGPDDPDCAALYERWLADQRGAAGE